MTVTVADLKKHESEHAILYCRRCGGEYSATPGDYWDLDGNYDFCCYCQENDDGTFSTVGTPMELVVKHTTYKVLEA